MNVTRDIIVNNLVLHQHNVWKIRPIVVKEKQLDIIAIICYLQNIIIVLLTKPPLALVEKVVNKPLHNSGKWWAPYQIVLIVIQVLPVNVRLHKMSVAQLLMMFVHKALLLVVHQDQNMHVKVEFVKKAHQEHSVLFLTVKLNAPPQLPESLVLSHQTSFRLK